MCKQEFIKDINRAVFPGMQGGPLMHVIAAKAVALGEALRDEFRRYQAQILRNAQALSTELGRQGLRIVSGGTENHVFLVDVTSVAITGKIAEGALERADITVNKNTIPYDENPPMVASGIRIGTPALTSRGMLEPEMHTIAAWIRRVLEAPDDDAIAAEVRADVHRLCERFPLYADLG